MYQTPVTIEQTLHQIERHQLVLPAIQREFVWEPEQICTLFDSLMQGYPFGTFLYWKVSQEHNTRYQFYDFVREYHERDDPHCHRLGEMPNRDVIAVLDGQQRLTALNNRSSRLNGAGTPLEAAHQPRRIPTKAPIHRHALDPR